MLSPKFSKIIILTTIVVLITVAGFFIVQNIKNKEKEKLNLERTTKETSVSKPWIEVISAQTAKKNSETGEFLTELETGDELEPGETIKTNENGLAIIHFPDGSMARMEENSSLVIEESSFNEETESLKVRIKLKLGRVWCRVIQLVTTDSFWEVKTSNVVATVRGTAFGIETSEKKSSILVDDGKVEAEAFDSAINKKIEGTKTILEKNKIIEVKKEKIKELKAKPTELAVKEIPQEILLEKWVTRNKEADVRFDEKIQKLEQKGMERKEIKIEIKKEFYEKIEKRRKQRQAEGTEGRGAEKQGIIKPELELKTDEQPIEQRIENKKTEGAEGRGVDGVPSSEPSQKPIAEETAAKPKSLAIIISQINVILSEGDVLNLKAILTMTNGAKKEVTQECEWKVLGKIGIMKAPGIFVAKLDPSISELGQAPGQIVCVWSDPKTLETFLGSAPIIKVQAKVEENFETRG
jgi:hypothetical protein